MWHSYSVLTKSRSCFVAVFVVAVLAAFGCGPQVNAAPCDNSHRLGMVAYCASPSDSRELLIGTWEPVGTGEHPRQLVFDGCHVWMNSPGYGRSGDLLCREVSVSRLDPTSPRWLGMPAFLVGQSEIVFGTCAGRWRLRVVGEGLASLSLDDRVPATVQAFVRRSDDIRVPESNVALVQGRLSWGAESEGPVDGE